MTLLFATLGSLGDVKPMVAIAAFARDCGHSVRFATSPGHRRLVEEAGLRYETFGRDAFFDSSAVRDAIVDPPTGFGVFMWHSNLSALEELYRQLSNISRDAELVIATPLVMPAHLVACGRGLPFVSCVFSPAMVLREASIGTVDPYQGEWRRRLNALRLEIDLPPRSFPQMQRFSADLTLGVYPSYLSPASGHYISKPLEVGYPRRRISVPSMDERLADWVSDGDFALVSFGSFVDRDAKNCFRSAVEACRHVGLRCLYVSKYSAEHLGNVKDRDVLVERFVEHSQVMPCAGAIVHHGGTGTLVESVLALRPTVVVPFGLDQTYNASRVQEGDLAEVLRSALVTPNSLAGALSCALDAWPRRKEFVLNAASEPSEHAEVKALREIERVLSTRGG